MSAPSALSPKPAEQLRLPLERAVGDAFVVSDSNAEAVRVLAA